MQRPPVSVPPEESSARFIFQAAIGVGSFCLMAVLVLGANGSQAGAVLFFVLALISLGVLYRYGHRYLALRQQRWARELEHSRWAMEQLLDRARHQQAADAPGAADEEKDHA